MTQDDEVEKVARFEAALNQLIERIAEDRYVLAVVLVGSLSTETIWHREALALWIIEADGVSSRGDLAALCMHRFQRPTDRVRHRDPDAFA